MNKKEFIIFILALVLPFIYFRTIGLLLVDKGYTPFTRNLTGLNVHHLHFGILYMVIAALIIILYKKNIFSIALMGIGLSFVLDEFTSTLYIQTIRTEELLVYSQHLFDTIILFLIVIIISLLFYLKSIKGK